jgi:TonB-dependent starch-binding outer membrane protein SusC
VGYYNNRSGSQLIGYSLPSITGFSTIAGNFPAIVQNTGFELEITANLIKNRDFKWTVNANLIVPRNKLVAFPGISSSSYANSYVVGQPLSVYRGYVLNGIDPQSGIYTFADRNNSGTVDAPADYDVLAKKIQQFYYGGLQSSLQYKGVKLDVQFQFVGQNGRKYLATYPVLPGMLGNQPRDVLDRWQKPGDHREFQRFTQTSGDVNNAYTFYRSSDGIVGDASYLRIKNIFLSYDFPNKWIPALSQCRLFLQGQNLFTISKYVGLDPETQNSSSLPTLKWLTVGFQLTF